MRLNVHPLAPGSPVVAPARPPARHDGTGGVSGTPATVLRLEAPAEWRQGQREAARGQAPGGANTRRVRTDGKSAATRSTRRATTATVEAKARAAWHPGMTVTQLERAAGISRASAGKFRRKFLAETHERQERSQVAQ